jgi:hypothetical protein
MAKLEYLKEIQAAEEQGFYDPSKATPDFVSLSTTQHYYMKDYNKPGNKPHFLPYPPLVEHGDNTTLDLQIMIPFSGKAKEEAENTEEYKQRIGVYKDLQKAEKILIEEQDEESDLEKSLVLVMSQLKEIRLKQLGTEYKINNLKRLITYKHIRKHAATYANRTQELKQALLMSICIFFHDARSFVDDYIDELLSIDIQDEMEKEMAILTAHRVSKITYQNLLNELFYNAVRNNTGLYPYILLLKENDNTAYMEVLECIDYCLCEVLKKRDENKSELKKLFKALIPKQPSKALPLPQMPKRPGRYIAPNNKLINTMATQEIINAGARDLTVSPDKGITTYFVVGVNDGSEKPLKMSNSEREVLNAVCSIYKQAETDRQELITMTPTSIYKAMPGGSNRPTQKKQNEIITIFETLRKRPLVIDATAELRAFKKIGENETYTIDSQYLHADKHTYKRQNGTETVGWRLFAKPALLDYAERTGQLINVEFKITQILDVDKKEQGYPPININDKRRDVLTYLIRRVAVMKNAWAKAKKESKKQERAAKDGRRKKEDVKSPETIMKEHKAEPTIIYDSLYAAVDADLTNRNQLKDIREFSIMVMKYWQHINFIDGYKEISKGRKKTSIRVKFN